MSFDTPDTEEQCTPRLGGIVGAFHSSVSPEFRDWRLMSVNDSFGLDPSAFICNGEDIIEAARAAASGPSASEVKRETMEPVGSTSSPFFKPKKFKSKVFEPQQEDVDRSAQALERKDRKIVAVSVLQLMDQAYRERFLPGVSELPAAAAEKVLLASIEQLA